MSQLVLQYHNKYRLTHAHRSKGPLAWALSILDGTRYDEDSDIIALFLFSLQAKEDHDQGLPLQSGDYFWTEVFLCRQLAATAGWKTLSKKAKCKQMFRHAVEELKNARRKLRQVTLAWTPGSGIEKGPAVAAAEIDFPEESLLGKLAIAAGIRNETFLDPIIIETESSEALRFMARTGAGLAQG